MSIIETLTEGIVNRNMEREGAALLNKWAQTGLLEGLDASQQQNMAVLLENQAKSLLKESNSMTSGPGIEGFAAVAFPIVRRVFAGLIANDLVSVQPMSLPSGLIFFLDFVYSDNPGASNTQASRFGNVVDESIYGTDKVGSQITGGVNLVDSLGGDTSGPGRGGMTGYAYGSPTGSNTELTNNAADATILLALGIPVFQFSRAHNCAISSLQHRGAAILSTQLFCSLGPSSLLFFWGPQLRP